MSDLEQLIKQREELDQQIERLHQEQREEVLNKIRHLMDLHNLSTDDLMIQPRRTRVQRQSVAPKFRDPASGATWTGRGRAPRWLEGKDKEAYRI
jgi:DNA-binding protein H-NS